LDDREAFHLRLFSLSLTGTAFEWYAALPPNSIIFCNDLESKFHGHFFFGEYELELVDLASLQQGNEESLMIISRDSRTLETDASKSML
jgi:hypothetical protein